MKRLLDSLSWFIIGLLYVFVISALLSNILYGEGGISYFSVLLISAIFYVVANIIFLNRTTSKVFAAIAIVLVIAAVVYCFVNVAIVKVVDIHAGRMYITWDRILSQSELPPEADIYLKASLVITAFVASILVIILFKKIKSFFLINGITLALFVIATTITKGENKLLFTIFCVLLIVSFINKVSTKKSKEGSLPEDLSVGSMLICSIPVILIPVLFIARIPKSESPIQNNLMRTINSIITEIENRFKYTEFESFSLSEIGFADKNSNRLGGDIKLNNIEVLRVKSKVRTYLRGAIYDTYENSVWTKSYSLVNANKNDLYETVDVWSQMPVEQMFSKVEEDDLEFLKSLENGDLESIIFPTYSMEVTIRNLKTNILFTPLKHNTPIRYGGNEIIPTYEINSGIIIANSMLSKGDKYKFTFIQPMYGDDLFKKALRYSRDDLYNDAIQLLNAEKSNLTYQYLSLPSTNYISNEPGIIIPSISEDSLSPEQKELQEKIKSLDERIDILSQLEYKSKEIYSNYTKLPYDLPDRVIALAYEITDGHVTTYDKCVAVEQYLRDNHTYTYSPGEVPLDRDLVDYFLFDKREGYCSYYATSMVTLLRLLGIPARYVEGYVLPSEQAFEEEYTVTNRNAHAWVEVYFEGFGWMVFEPTTAYAGALNYKSAFSALDYQDNPSYKEMMERYKSSNFSSNTYTPSNPLDPIETKPQQDTLKTLIIILASVVGFIILLFIIDIAIIPVMLIRFKIINKEKAALYRYYQMIRWLSIKGYIIDTGTTAREFADYVDKLFILTQSFREVTEVFSKIRYGHQSITDEEYEIVVTVYKELRKQVLKEIGIKRYLPLRRLILGI